MMAANVAGHIDEVLREGGESAREIAIDTMRDVRRLVGFTPLWFEFAWSHARLDWMIGEFSDRDHDHLAPVHLRRPVQIQRDQPGPTHRDVWPQLLPAGSDLTYFVANVEIMWIRDIIVHGSMARVLHGGRVSSWRPDGLYHGQVGGAQWELAWTCYSGECWWAVWAARQWGKNNERKTMRQRQR